MKYFNNKGASNNDDKFIMASGTLQTMEVFADTVKRAMEVYFGNAYQVNVEKMSKNNGIVLTGLIIQEKKSNIAPMIYLDNFYQNYQSGETMANVCKEIIRIYEEQKTSMEFDVRSITEFSKVKERICYKLVHAKRNQELLKETPHFLFHDLAVIFYVLVSQEEEGLASITIKKDLQKIWKVDNNTLFQVALQNTQRLFRGSVAPIEVVLTELVAEQMGNEVAMEFYDMLVCEDAIPMYVASNHMKLEGAGVIFYKDLLRNFAKKVNSDFYIIPCSVHEVIFVPTSAALEPSMVKELVHEVNATEVAPEEILSDNIYYYNREADRVEML